MQTIRSNKYLDDAEFAQIKALVTK